MAKAQNVQFIRLMQGLSRQTKIFATFANEKHLNAQAAATKQADTESPIGAVIAVADTAAAAREALASLAREKFGQKLEDSAEAKVYVRELEICWKAYDQDDSNELSRTRPANISIHKCCSDVAFDVQLN